MFGIKIINEKELSRLKQIEQDWELEVNKYREQIFKTAKDCTSLREQLNEKIKQIRELELEKNAPSFSTLTQLHIIKTANNKCDTCKYGVEKCKKLEFANKTICVCGKEDAPTFK